ncbi:MAG: hypothetical protein IPI79_14220 [Moraxellaceae bacterium]|nr:hypothetical protein [Moraxellaceae bacterium]
MREALCVVVKNYIALAAFDSVGLEAVDLVYETEDKNNDGNESWLLLALLSLSTTQQIDEVIDWLKRIHQKAKITKEVVLLAVHLSPLILNNPQARVEFLRTLSSFANSVILIAPLEGETPTQSLARLPQFLVNLIFKPGMINLDCVDLSNRMQRGIAFFGYGVQQMLDDGNVEDMSAPMAEICQQWRSSYLQSAHVQSIFACIDGNENLGLEQYMAVGEQLQQSHDVFIPAKDMSLSIGMSVKDDTKSKEIHIGVLFWARFYESTVLVS